MSRRFRVTGSYPVSVSYPRRRIYPTIGEAHPDGCPQGVESCFVSASYNSYEEACKACCESRFHEPTQEYACWDEAHSLCRYPTDCGLPLWP